MSKIDWTAIDHPISGIYSLRKDSQVTDFAPYVESLPAQAEELVVVISSTGEAIICHLNDLPKEGEEDFKYVEEWINRGIANAIRINNEIDSFLKFNKEEDKKPLTDYEKYSQLMEDWAKKKGFTINEKEFSELPPELQKYLKNSGSKPKD